MKAFVVMVGQVFGPKTMHGPFKDSDDVNQWVSLHCKGQHYEVVALEPTGGWKFTYYD